MLNHVVLAEINFFQQEKVTDLSQYMKTFVDEQIQFYEKVKKMLIMKTSITFEIVIILFRSRMNYVMHHIHSNRNEEYIRIFEIDFFCMFVNYFFSNGISNKCVDLMFFLFGACPSLIYLS